MYIKKPVVFTFHEGRFSMLMDAVPSCWHAIAILACLNTCTIKTHSPLASG